MRDYELKSYYFMSKCWSLVVCVFCSGKQPKASSPSKPVSHPIPAHYSSMELCSHPSSSCFMVKLFWSSLDQVQYALSVRPDFFSFFYRSYTHVLSWTFAVIAHFNGYTLAIAWKWMFTKLDLIIYNDQRKKLYMYLSWLFETSTALLQFKHHVVVLQ